MELPPTLRPTTAEAVSLADGTLVRIPKVRLTLPRWRGAALPSSSPSWRVKPLTEVAGRPYFAELAVRDCLAAAGWEARWVETYGTGAEPLFLEKWIDGPLSTQQSVPITSFSVRVRLAAIAAANGRHRYAGCWDVVAWQSAEPLFLEVKRADRDRLQPTQGSWLDAALRCGLTAQNFLLVEWDFPT